MNLRADQTPDNDEAIEAMAASWLVQQEEGFTPEQSAEFARWRAADPRHAQALAMLEETCGLLEKMPLLREELEGERAGIATVPGHNPAEATGDGRGPRKILRFPAMQKIGMVAAACFALVATAWWMTARRDAVTFNETYTTANGGYHRVALPDDSVLELNAGTSVRVQLSRGVRRVTLLQGEAHFAVAKNPERPFVVAAGTVAVRAVGTAFNVRLDRSNVDVLVTEGRVEVSRASAGTAASKATKAPNSPALPTYVAGQRIVVPLDATAGQAPKVTVVDATGIRETLAWQSPRLVFLDTPLSDVVQRFNQHNRIQLVIDDPELGQRPVGGTFRADHVQTFVRLLEDTREISADRSEQDRIVLKKVAPR